MLNLIELRKFVEKKEHEREFIQNRLNELKNKELELKKRLETVTKSEEVVIEVGKRVQEELCYSVEEIVNLVLKSCFNYNFEMDYVVKRSKTELDMYIQGIDGDRIYPMDASGGGVVDVISFGLRIALWALSGNKENVIILDEPFKYLSRDLLPVVGEMLSELSFDLGFQIIIVTHSELMMDIVKEEDKLFKVEKIGKESIVKEVG